MVDNPEMLGIGWWIATFHGMASKGLSNATEYNILKKESTI